MPTRLMIIVGSVRPGRIGLPIATWVRERAEAHGGFDVDFVDLAELGLPFMDEPNHPILHQYTKPHTIAWGERVAAADAFLFVTPGVQPQLLAGAEERLDFLNKEWWRKPIGVRQLWRRLGRHARRGRARRDRHADHGQGRRQRRDRTSPGTQVIDGVFVPNEKESALIEKELVRAGRALRRAEALAAERAEAATQLGCTGTGSVSGSGLASRPRRSGRRRWKSIGTSVPTAANATATRKPPRPAAPQWLPDT